MASSYEYVNALVRRKASFPQFYLKKNECYTIVRAYHEVCKSAYYVYHVLCFIASFFVHEHVYLKLTGIRPLQFWSIYVTFTAHKLS